MKPGQFKNGTAHATGWAAKSGKLMKPTA